MAHHGRKGPGAVPPANAPKARGRTAKTTAPDPNAGPEAREGNVWNERQMEVNRPIGRGGGKLRGDRQDTHSDPGMRGNAQSMDRGNRRNLGLRNDRDPRSTAGRRNNNVPNEGG